MAMNNGNRASWYSAALIVGSLIVAFSLAASNPAGRWVDPPPPPNSLAREAERKLAALVDHVQGPEVHRDGPIVTEPPTSPYVVIDTHTNRLYWRTADTVLLDLLCSTGTGAELDDPDDDRRWRFDTPRGIFAISAMAADPIWRRPDWAFIEQGEAIPDSAAARLDPDALGGYAIAFGDGYYIHGTISERLIGVAVTHGCIRLAAADLANLYSYVSIGTPVVIF
jgi:L,D-transpeptidase YbiS